MIRQVFELLSLDDLLTPLPKSAKNLKIVCNKIRTLGFYCLYICLNQIVDIYPIY